MTGARLVVDIRKTLGALRLDVSFRAEPGVLVLFGPSGAGKTTVLNAIAGLVRPDGGCIEVHGRTLFRDDGRAPASDVPARLRNVGYVMQDYALFPHLSALGNVAYPLRRAPDRDRIARDLLARVGMDEFAAVYPQHLSGGQRQRVAIARALALRTPLLLLDEPFAALDGAVRERLQDDLRELQRDLALIVVLVTHRVEDLFALGDTIAVIDAGRVFQTGAVGEVFASPASRRVAALLGVRNVLDGTVVEAGEEAVIDWDGLRLRTQLTAPAAGVPITTFIRPEDVKIVYPDRPLSPAVAGNLFDARIASVRQSASMRIIAARLENDRLIEIRFPELSYRPLRLEPGSVIRVALRREGIVLIPR